jgi:hypothetical protein
MFHDDICLYSPPAIFISAVSEPLEEELLEINKMRAKDWEDTKELQCWKKICYKLFSALLLQLAGGPCCTVL